MGPVGLVVLLGHVGLVVLMVLVGLVGLMHIYESALLCVSGCPGVPILAILSDPIFFIRNFYPIIAYPCQSSLALYFP